MRVLIWLFLAFPVGLIILAIYLYTYLGFGESVRFSIEDRPDQLILSREHRGPYHLIGRVIHEVEDLALREQIPCPETFGEYFDNPDTTDEDRLHSRGGCLLPAPIVKKSLIGPDLQEAEWKAGRFVVGRFQGSPAIGPFKVYPKARQFIEEQRLQVATPVVEIYRVSGNQVTTTYLWRILVDPNQN